MIRLLFFFAKVVYKETSCGSDPSTTKTSVSLDCTTISSMSFSMLLENYSGVMPLHVVFDVILYPHLNKIIQLYLPF